MINYEILVKGKVLLTNHAAINLSELYFHSNNIFPEFALKGSFYDEKLFNSINLPDIINLQFKEIEWKTNKKPTFENYFLLYIFLFYVNDLTFWLNEKEEYLFIFEERLGDPGFYLILDMKSFTSSGQGTNIKLGDLLKETIMVKLENGVLYIQ